MNAHAFDGPDNHSILLFSSNLHKPAAYIEQLERLIGSYRLYRGLTEVSYVLAVANQERPRTERSEVIP
jgi:hypothetical protein